MIHSHLQIETLLKQCNRYVPPTHVGEASSGTDVFDSAYIAAEGSAIIFLSQKSKKVLVLPVALQRPRTPSTKRNVIGF